MQETAGVATINLKEHAASAFASEIARGAYQPTGCILGCMELGPCLDPNAMLSSLSQFAVFEQALFLTNKGSSPRQACHLQPASQMLQERQQRAARMLEAPIQDTSGTAYTSYLSLCILGAIEALRVLCDGIHCR